MAYKTKKEYNGEKKQYIREVIVEEILKRDIKNIVTLESPDFTFSEMLPNKRIIVFEKDADIYQEMENNNPKNVELIFGNISKLGIFNTKVDMIYLDFCKTWMSEKQNIIPLIESLKKVKLFAITLSTRITSRHKSKGFVPYGDYQFDLVRRIQELTNINWKIVWGECYYDSSQMITAVFEKPEKEVIE